MRSIKSRFVIGPSNILFAGVYVSIFQPGNFTGWGSEGVNDNNNRKQLYNYAPRAHGRQTRTLFPILI